MQSHLRHLLQEAIEANAVNQSDKMEIARDLARNSRHLLVWGDLGSTLALDDSGRVWEYDNMTMEATLTSDPCLEAAAIRALSRMMREFESLLPLMPADSSKCVECSGTGWIELFRTYCPACCGRGWQQPTGVHSTPKCTSR